MEKTKQYPSSFNKLGDVEQVELNQPTIPLWFVMVFLIFCFFVLKSFIYTKDEKKDGK